MKQKILYIIVLIMCFCTMHAQEKRYTDVKKIMNNIYVDVIHNAEIDKIDQSIINFRKYITSDGLFTDIDYNSKLASNWSPQIHTQRILCLSEAYIHPKSKFYKDETVYDDIIRLLDKWYDLNLHGDWYYNEIRCPKNLGLSFVLLRYGQKQIPSEIENKLVDRMQSESKGPDQKGSQGTAANKMSIALAWIYRALLQENIENLKFACEQFYKPLVYNENQGIQSDAMYLQHGRQLYAGNYGRDVLFQFLDVASFLHDTPYEDKEKTAIMSEYMRKTILPCIRGRIMTYNQMGRHILDPSNAVWEATPQLRKMLTLDKKYSKIYKNAFKRMDLKVLPKFAIKPYHRHFWRSDYTLHQRSCFTMDVRMVSTRTARCEIGHGKNVKGYFLCEGGTAIARRGDEYFDIFYAWDWTHIPGTTAPNVPVIPRPGDWEHSGQSQFAGGVSDGIYGITTYQLIDKNYNINTTGNKSWFFFDKEVVCMGNHIQSTNPYEIHTTVNQCLLKGKIHILNECGEEETVQDAGERRYNHLKCIVHDSISYYFPKQQDVTISNGLQTGNVKDVATYLPSEVVKRNVFKVWINHGIKPTSGNYVYYIMPCTTSTKEVDKEIDDLMIINNDSVQAVYNRSLHILGVIFYKKGAIAIDDIYVNSSNPCIVMLKNINKKKVNVYVADPSYSLPSVQLNLKLPESKECKRVNCNLSKDIHYIGATSSGIIHIHSSEPENIYPTI